MRVLVAPDKFKGTLSARSAAQIVGEVLADLGHDVDAAPMADGGEGTLDAFVEAGWSRVWVDVVDGRGRSHRSCYAASDGTVMIELAELCGLATVDDLPRDPWTATSRGLGIAARHAIAGGATHIDLAVGGSASIDGGIGMLAELGARVTDASGGIVTSDLRGLLRAAAVHLASIPGVRWRLLSDVASPLVGSTGALAYAAQKGLAPDRFDEVDAGLRRWAVVLTRSTGHDPALATGAGAAGGVGAAAIAALDAHVVSGAEEIAAMVDLEDRIRRSDLVVTGEGRFDVTSRLGKAPGVVIGLAQRHGVPVHVIAGSIADDADRGGIASLSSCGAVDPDPAVALSRTARRWALDDVGRSSQPATARGAAEARP